MDNSIKRNNLLVIVFEVLVISLGVVGITFAVSKLVNDRTATLLTASEYEIDYVGDKDILFDNLMPIDDSLVNYGTRDNVIRLEFSLRGGKSNKNDDLIYDVMLNEMNIDCSLLNKYTKWNLYKNGELISNGSLDPSFDGDVLSENMYLTNTQETLPKYNQDYDNYVLLLWISEACDNLETCELVDQSSILDSTLSMKVFIAVYSGSKTKHERIPNYDHTCANRPELLNNMVPVKYLNNNWVVAPKDNNDSDNLWYNYENKEWANAVVVNNSSKYDKEGMQIDSRDVLGYYVWIPRYSYKLWNATDKVSDSYNAYEKGISINFENGLNSKKVDKYENDKYITHPAFGDNLRGFWIGKYELSYDNKYKVVPEVNGYHTSQLELFSDIVGNLSNDYHLGDKVTSSVVSNMEWGAVTYLSHSKYGTCNFEGCPNVGVNENYLLGTYDADTTTGNKYGVYDMAGAASEYVIGTRGIGSATNEVLTQNGSWYNSQQTLLDGEYLLRGGVSRGLYYYFDLGMSSVEIGVRNVLKKGE